MTVLLRTGVIPHAYLAAALTATATQVEATRPLADGEWYGIDDETIMVLGTSVVRGVLRSDANRHRIGTPLFRQRIVEEEV